jgi:hypothetical protein
MIRLEDIPVKLLRSFCVQQKYGIHHLSTRDKVSLLQALNEADPNALVKFIPWLDERNRISREKVEIESLPNGRRLTVTRGDRSRIFEETDNSSNVTYLVGGEEVLTLEDVESRLRVLLRALNQNRKVDVSSELRSIVARLERQRRG